MNMITYAAHLDDGKDLTMEQWAKISEDVKKVVRNNLIEMFPPYIGYTESCFPSDVIEMINEHGGIEEGD